MDRVFPGASDPDAVGSPARTKRGPTRPRQGVVIIGLLIAYLPMYAPTLTGRLGFEPPLPGPMGALFWNWLATLALIAYIVGVERNRLRSILLTRPSSKDIEWAFYAFGIVMAYSWVIGMIRPQTGNEGVETITSMPVIAVCALIITTALTEEILYRGYPIERLSALTGRRWIGTAVSVVLFVAPHLTFFGWEWLLYSGFGTVVAYILYFWRRNLWVCIVLHCLTNAPILIPTVLS